MSFYEWFDPHERRRVADNAPERERAAFQSGVGAGQSQMNQMLRSGVFEGIKRAAEDLGRKVPNQPEFLEAVEKVAQGFAHSHDYRVSFYQEPQSMTQMVVQEVQVRPFKVSVGVRFRFSEQDLYERRYAY